MNLELIELVYIERLVTEEITYLESLADGMDSVGYEVCEDILNKIKKKYAEVKGNEK